MRVLVTGATGYFGLHVATDLVEQGHDVSCTGSRDPSRWFHLLNACHPVDLVIHLAWFAAPGNGQPELQARSLENSKALFDRVAESPNPPWLVFASTLSVYGAGEQTSYEHHDPQPGCAYTRAKTEAETYLAGVLPKQHTVLRYGSMMGLGVGRTRTDLVVNAFAAEAYTRGRFEVWNPAAWKPVIHVRDASTVTLLAGAERWAGTYNVCAQCVRAEDIARLVSYQPDATYTVVGGRNGYRSTRVSVDKMMKKLGVNRSVRWREIPEAVREFEGFVPDPSNRTTPW